MKNDLTKVDINFIHNQLKKEKEKNDFLETILDSIQHGISVLDKDYKIIKSNKWTEEVYGNGQPLKGSFCYKAYQGNDSICQVCPAKMVFDTGKTYIQVLPMHNNKGWIEVTAFPIKNNKGEVIQVLESFRDISEQKALEFKLKEKAKEYKTINEELVSAEEELKSNIEDLHYANKKIAESKEKFEGLYNYAPLAYQSLDINGNIIEVNPSWLKTLGYEREEVIGKWFGNFLHPKSVQLFEKNFSIFKKQGYINDAQYILKKKDNTTIHVSYEGNISYTPEGKFKQTFCTFKDISREKLFELSFKESEEKYRILVNAAPYGIQLSDNHGKILYSNRAHHEIHGCKNGEIVGKYIWDFIVDKNEKIKTREYYKMLVKEQPTPTIYYAKNKRKDGEIIDTQIKWEYIRNENGELTGIISIIIDITERQKKEIELIEAKEKAEESDRLKSEFLNNMSHEIRTPMNGIIGFTDILNQEGLSEEKRKYYRSIIKSSSNQLLRIIDDILEISSLETKQVKPFITDVCLNDLLMELFSIFNIKAKENKIHLYLKKGLGDKDCYIKTDKTKLSKAINNLVENALKFTFEGFVEIGYTAKDQTIEIYIKDTGIGIDPKNFDVIFKRFSQEDKNLSRKIGGLGLGLSIAKENIELIGGTINLESKKGKGTTFYITLPHKTKALSKTHDLSKEPEKKIKTFKVLVAEDEEINSIYIEEVLKLTNNIKFEVIQVKNGKEAVDICASDHSINLVLMDIKMPVMNGHEATQIIKKTRPDLPIIAQTAFSTEKDREEALSKGFDDFLSKPIEKEILYKTVKELIDPQN